VNHDLFSLENELRHIEDYLLFNTQRAESIKAQIKQIKESGLVNFLSELSPGTVIVFDKCMSNSTYTYAITKAPYAWFSTGKISGARNPSLPEIVRFIRSGGVKVVHSYSPSRPFENSVYALQ
jgi:hypothetical protein